MSLGAMPARPASGWTLAVATDTTAPAPRGTRSGSGLEDDAALLAAVSGLVVTPLTLTTRAPADLAARLHALPLQVGAIFLTRTERAWAHETQHLLRDHGARPLITDDDATAITLTATALTYLARLHRSLGQARTVVVGAETMPIMCALLLASGNNHVSVWHPHEATSALERACRHADLVINLLAAQLAVRRVAMDRPAGSVIEIGGDHEHLLALPGLSRAVAGAPGAPVDLEAYHACVHGLVTVTPPGWSLTAPPWSGASPRHSCASTRNPPWRAGSAPSTAHAGANVRAWIPRAHPWTPARSQD
ncbi:hypothetical protein [Pseudonocardia eucalypti]|uniref:hypothetical protein n=1 Tax=Pseudonocardia eucalypti TaxID=648755 RepID=UPI00161C0E33